MHWQTGAGMAQDQRLNEWEAQNPPQSGLAFILQLANLPHWTDFPQYSPCWCLEVMETL